MPDGSSTNHGPERTASEVANEDLRALMRLLGMSLGARPKSPHEVFQTEVLPKVKAIHDALIQAKPIVEYVSMGRGYVGVDIFPDATARRVNAQIREALDA